MPGRVTLRDVAAKTGYAVITISKALRNHGDIAPKTRELIQATAREMGYVPNASASSLRSGVTHTLALIIGDIANPFFSIVAKQVEACARQYGYAVAVMNTDERQERENKAIDTAIAMNVDGALLFPCQESEESLEKARAYQLPCVLMGRRFQQENCPSVVFDDYKGGYLATRHLLERGYRRILMLNGALYIYGARERYRGYLAAHREAGVSPIEELAVSCGNLSNGCADRIPPLLPLQFDALFAYNDILAFEAIKILGERGLRVPEDIGVVGVDDIVSAVPYPFPLTSVALPEKELAQTGMEMLMALLHAPDNAPDSRVLDVGLMVRGSTR